MSGWTQLKLNGVIEAALNRCMNDEQWLADMAKDQSDGWDLPNTTDGVFAVLESFAIFR